MEQYSVNRSDIEKREAQMLAPYAAMSSKSRGRVYPLKEHVLRTAFQRDRDRIIHSAAFRRMEYKTQVFIPHEQDHYRTRLTHTIEVAQISRTLARILRLNEDLSEAIALAHDLGHTPFGHSGEDVLNDLLEKQGGFNHNRQSLRIIDLLEQRYAEHPGLNLSYEVREGIAKHETKVQIRNVEFSPDERPTLEASLVDIADEITYNAHDVDDGLSSGIITPEDIQRESFWSEMQLSQAVRALSVIDDMTRYALVRGILVYIVTDVAIETVRRLRGYRIADLEDVRKSRSRICDYSPPTRDVTMKLKEFLNQKLYRHPKLQTMSEWAREIIETIFTRLKREPTLMPRRFQEMLLTEEKEIVIADYIAGMTDRFAIKMYEQVG